ncbi:Imm26 family immunity protein [Burkholderia pseudomallei]|uniref:Imm26 family immunity protein n=1 Tax=Burkholderia pseudomallei TaxID=28450 RepID=UPI000F077A3B|nr:Imm26 family immunity protein [Burkholderia pseudomallei]MBF4045284.1 hypothetical protein [Burkholderia pseudomallei]
MKRVKYEEGTWFALPVGEGGFAAGVIARSSRTSRGILFGYFFPHVYKSAPDIGELCKLRPSDAIATIRFGDMGLIREEWTVIGKCESWKREEWAIPAFLRTEPITSRAYEVHYDPDDPAKRIGERLLHDGDARPRERPGLFGDQAVERYVSHLLGFEVPPLDLDQHAGKK